jgi:hypothetical protein
MTSQWVGHPEPCGRNLAWTCEQLPGVVVRHCGRPTALRPYHVQGANVTGSDHLVSMTFAQLVDAQAAAVQSAQLVAIARPAQPKARARQLLPDPQQCALAF